MPHPVICRRRAIVALTAFACASAAIADAPPTYTIQRVGLVSGPYQYLSGATPIRLDTPLAVTPAGVAAGTSARFTPAGEDRGRDAWLFDGLTSTPIGFFGGVYEYAPAPTGSPAYRESEPTGLNAAGRVIGHTLRWIPSGEYRGQDAWTTDGLTTLQLGYTGPGYEFTAARFGGIQRFSEALAVNASGAVIGYSARYNTNGNGRGRDPWLWTPPTAANPSGTLQRLGFTGTNYEYSFANPPLPGDPIVRNSDVLALTDSGFAAGHSQRYAASGLTYGRDAWVFDGATNRVAGLTDLAHSFALPGDTAATRINTLKALNSSGRAVGTANRYNTVAADTGVDAWYFHGTTTNVIGLAGGVYETGGVGVAATRNADVFGLSDSGRAAGTTRRYAPSGEDRGRDAWVSSGGPTQLVGLTGGANEWTPAAPAGGPALRSATIDGLTPGGRVYGRSGRFDPTTGAARGQDAWLYDGSATTRVGLAGPGYEWASAGAPTRSGAVLGATDAGLAVGVSARYAAAGADRGQAAWLFDAAAGTTTELVFSTRADGYAFTLPAVLTDAGVVLGAYKRYSAMAFAGDRAFWWSASTGFFDLGDVAPGSALTWASLNAVVATAGLSPSGAPLAILGTGTLAGGPAGTGYVMSTLTIPAPAAPLGLLTALPLLARRPRR